MFNTLRMYIAEWLSPGNRRYFESQFSPITQIGGLFLELLTSWALLLFIWTVRNELKDRIMAANQ
jgi:hypothetical protein